MGKYSLKRAIPNEQGHLILEFTGPEFRVFEASALSRQWPTLSLPQNFKRFAVSENAISWSEGGAVTAEYLYKNSQPRQHADIEDEVLRLSYKNQAPTQEHSQHHVYGVFIAPFSSKLFCVGDSLGGGFAGREESRELTITELLAWPEWRKHFELSGCSWAIPLIETLGTNADQLLSALVTEACGRNGLAEDA
jgi:hypothetical protein